MKNYKALFLLLVILFSITSCFEDNDDVSVTANEINDFVWKGMNFIYLYKDEVPDLANDRFSSDTEYAAYLDDFQTPRDLFESLRFQPQSVDRFSRIFSDFIALENLLQGTFTTDGMEYRIFTFSETSSERYGFVTHVLPNTSAASQGIKRGDIFYAVNGIQLTNDNRFQLLNQSNYTLNLGIYNNNSTPEVNDDFVEPTTQNINLSKTQYTENPIFINKILNVDNKKIGYLMYNGFTGTNQFNSQLNDVFGAFKSGGINDLVLDLRYNSGGSVASAILLSSLITGQFTGDIFSTQEWNSQFQETIENEDPEFLVDRFINRYNDAPINSLGLSKVYILTTGASASASELVINSLRPYVNVIQIGSTTTGKYQASTIIYDSPDFSRENANPGHTYAMLPLIYKSVNANGVTDYFNGLEPDITIREQIDNLGVLGTETEPYLAAAISDITGNSGKFYTKKTSNTIQFENGSKDYIPSGLGLYSDKKLPIDFFIK